MIASRGYGSWVRAVLLGASIGVLPSSGMAQTLDEALSAAYTSNPRLDAQRARLRSVDEQAAIAISGWRPSVQAFASTGYRRFDEDQFGLVDTSDNLFRRNFGATVDQPLFKGGSTIAQVREAEHTILAERQRLTATEQTVLLDAATAYNNVVRDQAVVELGINNEQRLAKQLQAARDRFQVGEVTRTDVFQAEAALARATADRVRAEGDLAASRANYRQVVGQMPGLLKRPNLPANLPSELKEAIDMATSNNPGVLAAEFDEQSSLDTVDRFRGELMPSVSLRGTIERDYEPTTNGSRFDTYEALINMTIPLYMSGATYARIRSAKQSVMQQRQQADAERRNAIEQATTAWNALQTAKAQIVSFTKEAEANRVALDGVQQEAQVGARTVLDILDAEQALLNSQVNLARSQRDEVVSAFQLISSVGTLTARNLKLAVNYYDYSVHYNEVRTQWIGTSSIGDSDQDFESGR